MIINVMKKRYKIKLLVIGCFLVTTFSSFAQRGYQEDSLQIKVYSEIIYDQFKPIKIHITKVFCDYCTENQIKHVKEIAWDLAYRDRNAPENVMNEGKKKLAIYLRIPKDKFRLLRDEQRRRR